MRLTSTERKPSPEFILTVLVSQLVAIRLASSTVWLNKLGRSAVMRMTVLLNSRRSNTFLNVTSTRLTSLKSDQGVCRKKAARRRGSTERARYTYQTLPQATVHGEEERGFRKQAQNSSTWPFPSSRFQCRLQGERLANYFRSRKEFVITSISLESFTA